MHIAHAEKRPIQFSTKWLALVSLVSTVFAFFYVFFYPTEALAAGKVEVNNNLTVLKGHVRLATGQPVANAVIDVQIPETVAVKSHGKTQWVTKYVHLVYLKTYSDGRFWGQFRIPGKVNSLVIVIKDGKHVNKTVSLIPGHATDFTMKVSKGFSLLGFQTFVY